ncbi:MAG: PIG-L deacetylase family protein [Opitutales bacterium]
MAALRFSQDAAECYIPDGSDFADAAARTTLLGIGAHPDDLEFMAYPGIAEGYAADRGCFAGVTCTDGAGSVQADGPKLSTVALADLRREEQREAARIGRYGFMVQLAHPSRHAREAAMRPHLIEDLRQLLDTVQPKTVYTHNVFDRHPSHLGVVLAVIAAIKALPAERRPGQLLGCEVWRGLDWLPAGRKLSLNASRYPQLAARLNGVFATQTTGGKRYDLAVDGRRRANATFDNAHRADAATHVTYAVDQTTLIRDGGPFVAEFVRVVSAEFSAELGAAIAEIGEPNSGQV